MIPNKGMVALKICKDDFGKVKLAGTDIVIQIDIEFEASHYFTQFNKVVAVSDDVKHIKEGMMVFHNHKVFAPERHIGNDVYVVSEEFVYGTPEKMFHDNVMIEPIFESKEIYRGTPLNPIVETISVQSENKAKILLGEHIGEIMYVSNVAFYGIVGFDKKIFITKEKQVICDLDLNPTKGKMLVIPDADEYLKSESGLFIKNSHRTKGFTGKVFKSNNSFGEGAKVGYERFYQITIDGIVYHSVLEKDVSLILN